MGMIEDAIASIATNLSRASLDSDPAMRERLLALEGRLVKVVCTLPSFSFFLQVKNGELLCCPTMKEKPNVVVTGNGADLARWLSAPARIDGIQIEGDEAVLLELSTALAEFSPNLLSPLTRFLGPETAQTMLGGAELAVSAFRSAAEGVGLALEKTAANRFVTRADTNALLDALDELRLRIDRLASRIKDEEQRR
jgi:ubiquinone biosynthesis protein UbiJ